MLQLHSTSLLVAASASLAIASVAAAAIGVRQRQRRGVWWWIAANLGLATALATHALEDQSDLLAPIAAVLGLQWPVVTLVGMRRYFARGGSSVPAWADAVVLGTSLLVVLGAWYLPWSDAVQARARRRRDAVLDRVRRARPLAARGLRDDADPARPARRPDRQRHAAGRLVGDRLVPAGAGADRRRPDPRRLARPGRRRPADAAARPGDDPRAQRRPAAGLAPQASPHGRGRSAHPPAQPPPLPRARGQGDPAAAGADDGAGVRRRPAEA